MKQTRLFVLNARERCGSTSSPTLRKLEGGIISFIDQPDVIKKILQHLGLWEESHAPSERDPPACSELVEPIKEITFDSSTVRPFEFLTALRRIEG
jgi:hypothetical protein